MNVLREFTIVHPTQRVSMQPMVTCVFVMMASWTPHHSFNLRLGAVAVMVRFSEKYFKKQKIDKSR